MADFIIVDALAIYDAIFVQHLLNAFWAIILTYYIAIKFCTGCEEITIKGNLHQLEHVTWRLLAGLSRTRIKVLKEIKKIPTEELEWVVKISSAFSHE